MTFTESIIEQAALDWLSSIGYSFVYGPDIACDGVHPERPDYQSVLLPQRLQDAIARLNPNLPTSVCEDAFRQLIHLNQPSLILNNHSFHHLLVNGIPVEYKLPSGEDSTASVKLIDFDDPDNNDWLVVNQFTVVGPENINRRPDITVFINGLPIAVIELKNAADENATVWSAFNQLQTYKQQIPELFHYNELLIISDGLNARIGSLTAIKEWFLPWKTIEGEVPAPSRVTQLEVLLKGVFEKQRLLKFLRHFIMFEQDHGTPVSKIIAGYHQFHATNVAIQQTIRASQLVRAAAEGRGHYSATVKPIGTPGDHRIGVVWHTQGAGKSYTMVFYAGRLAVQPEMENPTIVVITDRIDLDGQLFGTFNRCCEVLRQIPEQAESREDLQRKLTGRASGGIIFTTIHKFLEEFGVLSDRHNIVVIAD